MPHEGIVFAKKKAAQCEMKTMLHFPMEMRCA
jgi:hypothetical protein